MADSLNQSGASKHDQMMTTKTRLGHVHLAGLTADPADAETGDIWYRSDTNAYRVKTGAGVKTVTVA